MSDWSTDDLILIAAYYNSKGLKALDDSHEFCQRLANEIGQPAGGLDSQARMMRNIVRGDREGYKNAGKNAHIVANEYMLYHQESYDKANEIIDRNGYDLPKLP
jgi:hypothetical protein